MATSPSTVLHIEDQLSSLSSIRTRKMFGEYALYCDEKVVALICDEQLFVKPTEAGKARASDLEEGQAYPGSKPYWIVPEDLIEDRAWLSALIQATADALPAPKPKAKRKDR